MLKKVRDLFKVYTISYMSITSGEIPLIFISKLMRVLSNQALVAQPAGAGFLTNTLY